MSTHNSHNENKNLEKISIPVEGMTCASCVSRVEKALKKIEGIEEVSVNLATEKASFRFDPNKVDLKAAAAIIEDAGYKLNVESFSNKKEEVKTEAAHIHNEYEQQLKKDTIIAIILSIPVVVISMLMMFWMDFIHLLPLSHKDWNSILLILTTPIVFIPGKRFYKIFWNNLKHFTADMNSLVAIGTGAAYVFSILNTLFPQFLTKPGEVPHVYYESTAAIISLILLGRWLESRAKTKTNSAIKALMNLQPPKALVKRNGIEVEIDVNELSLNDIVIIKPGTIIPADGIVTSGNSVVDESMISGESLPVEKQTNSKVVGGTFNKTGAFEFKVTASGKNSVLGQIIKLVEEAQGSKAPIQNLADKIASIFVPVVVGIAVVTFIVWMFIPSPDQFNNALVNFISVLIIACPCALGLATPTAIMVGTGKGAQKGILIKNGESLELAHKITTLFLDKTGTITKGEPVVSEIYPIGITSDELIRLTASAEKKSEHPLADAVVRYAKDRNLTLDEPESFNSLTGIGITAIINGNMIAAGNMRMMKEYSIKLDEYNDVIVKYLQQGKTIIYTAVNGELKGLILIEDMLKEGSLDAVKELKKMGIKLVMITGDNKKTAEVIASKVGIENFEAEVLPQDKASIVKKYQNENEVVGMIGDGINDAPALAQSDVGIAIGSGTDIAIETGSIILIGGDLMGAVDAIKLSKKTIKVIKQNLFWAFIYNIIGIPLAAFGILPPIFAALAMSFSSVSVVSNSLRLKL
ncbi:MAG TPA: heavy metal translocating P-type ATPase [Ignavibacteriaceae bacterium]|nr:heavy metal translocating P-type ATPase [Ignavibacteriaceae bacterium]